MLDKILIATRNENKVKEIREKISKLSIEVLGLKDIGIDVDVDETGTTFAENAALKAAEYAKMSGIASLADDSGLEVKALGGRPGVLSARYGGKDTGHAEKMGLLLEELFELRGNSDRSARFVCALALADISGNVIFETEGVCNGNLAETPLGEGGFGYDPIFIPDGHSASFGELPTSVKQEISHRARAIEQFILFLGNYSSV